MNGQVWKQTGDDYQLILAGIIRVDIEHLGEKYYVRVQGTSAVMAKQSYDDIGAAKSAAKKLATALLLEAMSTLNEIE